MKKYVNDVRALISIKMIQNLCCLRAKIQRFHIHITFATTIGQLVRMKWIWFLEKGFM